MSHLQSGGNREHKLPGARLASSATVQSRIPYWENGTTRSRHIAHPSECNQGNPLQACPECHLSDDAGFYRVDNHHWPSPPLNQKVQKALNWRDALWWSSVQCGIQRTPSWAAKAKPMGQQRRWWFYSKIGFSPGFIQPLVWEAVTLLCQRGQGAP